MSISAQAKSLLCLLLLITAAKEPASFAGSPGDASATSGEATGENDLWSFQPPKRPPLPQAQDRSWAQTPVDLFILSGLEARGLRPSPPADRSVLLRRATFDLTGLPPTPAELREFLADHSATAYARVIDRLLASPHYGPQWGRHWLDVARYADSNGLDENIAHGNAWRYRDYVVDSFNADRPYSIFLHEQLAGDLLPGDDPLLRNRRLVATGFLTLGAKVLAEVDEQKMEMDIVDEQVDTFGRSILGLSLGCARCHDHKFDPISTRDYYALAGIFQSTRTMESFTKIARWNENALYDVQFEKRQCEHVQQVEQLKTELTDRVAEATAALQQRLGAGAAMPAEPEKSFPPETQQELKQLRDQLAALEKAAPQPPTAMSVSEGAVADTTLRLRGDHLAKGEVVPRGFPDALLAKPVALGSGASGRLELAEWLTQADHPLTARVMVNRVWRWHFGRGLVATPDDFGQMGERPDHPELLDWLAVEFIESGWSMKHLHRLIMSSAVYQMDSLPREPGATVDPDNRWLWRANVRRLRAEEIRDATLHLAGQLDLSMGGSILNVDNRAFIFDHTSKDETSYDSRQRSIYLPVIRNHLADAFALFDYADAAVPNGDRASSTVPAQALYLMNSDFQIRAAAELAARILAAPEAADDEQRLHKLYQLAYGRPGKPAELARARQFLQTSTSLSSSLGLGEQSENAQKPPSDQHDQDDQQTQRRQAWQLLCHAILISNEFLYVR